MERVPALIVSDLVSDLVPRLPLTSCHGPILFYSILLKLLFLHADIHEGPLCRRRARRGQL